MNEDAEIKAAGRNFKFLKRADDELERQAKESGKTMTAVLEDLLLGRRQFRPEVESFIAEQMAKFKRPRNEIIETALYVAMKLGHSEATCERHYKAVKTQAEAAEFWKMVASFKK